MREPRVSQSLIVLSRDPVATNSELEEADGGFLRPASLARYG